MFWRIITWAIVIGFVYRLMKNFIIPVSRVTSATNERLRQMQDQLKEMDNRMNQQNRPAPSPKKKDGDYIDYEEVR